MSDELRDRWITCLCGEVFMWTARQQVFYAAEGYPPPKRCHACRELKRATFKAREQEAATRAAKRLLDKVVR